MTMLKLTLYNANDKKYGGHDSILNLFFFFADSLASKLTKTCSMSWATKLDNMK